MGRNCSPSFDFPDFDITQACCSDAEELAKAFKALGHPARLTILSKLSSQDRHCCGDICSTLPLAQSTVSQHLKVLRECGFIELETAGQQSHYHINREKVDWLMAVNDRFFSRIATKLQLDQRS